MRVYLTMLCAFVSSSVAAQSAGTPNLEHMMGLKPVSAPRLERIIADNTVLNIAVDDDWKVFYGKNGEQRGTFRSDNDVGRWRIARSPLGSEICSSWTKWRPKEKCFPVFLNRDGKLVGMDGTKFSWVGTVSRGNPSNL
jgi:hypothetical protein